jgi:hypothetical protein
VSESFFFVNIILLLQLKFENPRVSSLNNDQRQRTPLHLKRYYQHHQPPPTTTPPTTTTASLSNDRLFHLYICPQQQAAADNNNNLPPLCWMIANCARLLKSCTISVAANTAIIIPTFARENGRLLDATASQ